MGVTSSLDRSNKRNGVESLITDILPDIDTHTIVNNTEIGRGNQGIVFSGYYKSNNVAIKFLYSITDDNISLQELRRELSITRYLYHRNIVRVYGFVHGKGKYTNMIGIVMDLLRGNSLSYNIYIIKRDNTYDQKLFIMLSICKGLIYLHDNNIIHRDIKSDNVLVEYDNNNNIYTRVVLADYGIAREINTEGANTKCGTFSYIAPEIISGRKYDKRADIYSLGVLLWEIIQQMRPLEDNGFPIITDINISQLINKLLSTDPVNRPSIYLVASIIQELYK